MTKFVSKKEVSSAEEIQQRAMTFKNQLAAAVPKFDPKFVLNTDQTGCQIQSSCQRTYTFKGEKITNVAYDNLSKTTHSYTAQYTVTLEGKLLPKVFICLQETNGVFGPRVQEQVNKIVDELGNVVVTCSKSGKLSTTLYKYYLTSVLKPYVEDEMFLFVIDSWNGQVNPELYDEIFYNEENEATCELKVIPGKCTSMCQPLDVYFYRQVKILIKRMQENAALGLENREINKREDLVKIHSLVMHLLGADAFNDMIRYAWYESGAGIDKPEFKNVMEICFPKDLYISKCSCQGKPFIKCSRCDKIMCFKCFYDNYHPKECHSV